MGDCDRGWNSGVSTRNVGAGLNVNTTFFWREILGHRWIRWFRFCLGSVSIVL